MKKVIVIATIVSAFVGCSPLAALPTATCEELGTPVPPHTKSSHQCCILGESCKHFTCDSSNGSCCENANGGAGPEPECTP